MNEDIDQIFRVIARMWQSAAASKDYETLLELSFTGRQLFKALKQEEAAEACLGTLHIAVSHLRDVYNSKSEAENIGNKENECSFCGRMSPDVRLGAAPSAFICEGCVATFSEIFANDVRSKQ